MSSVVSDQVRSERLPLWLRRPAGSSQSAREVKKTLRKTKLNTVCEEARCPNIAECFGRGTATFMILGDICTRGCRFCAVNTGKPTFKMAGFQQEAEHVAEAAADLGLQHVVVTSVARDDLADGGADGFTRTVAELRKRIPGVTVEILVPDMRGDTESIATLAASAPDVFNHNLETVPRLYRRVRPGASYQRSLDLLAQAGAARPEMKTKTGIMLGLGENKEEVRVLMQDAKDHGVQIFTAGQYMQPSRKHLPVTRYLPPEEFSQYEQMAAEVGFPHIAIGPLVRSSYRSEQFV